MIWSGGSKHCRRRSRCSSARRGCACLRQRDLEDRNAVVVAAANTQIRSIIAHLERGRLAVAGAQRGLCHPTSRWQGPGRGRQDRIDGHSGRIRRESGGHSAHSDDRDLRSLDEYMGATARIASSSASVAARMAARMAALCSSAERPTSTPIGNGLMVSSGARAA